ILRGERPVEHAGNREEDPSQQTIRRGGAVRDERFHVEPDLPWHTLLHQRPPEAPRAGPGRCTRGGGPGSRDTAAGAASTSGPPIRFHGAALRSAAMAPRG